MRSEQRRAQGERVPVLQISLKGARRESPCPADLIRVCVSPLHTPSKKGAPTPSKGGDGQRPQRPQRRRQRRLQLRVLCVVACLLHYLPSSFIPSFALPPSSFRRPPSPFLIHPSSFFLLSSFITIHLSSLILILPPASLLLPPSTRCRRVRSHLRAHPRTCHPRIHLRRGHRRRPNDAKSRDWERQRRVLRPRSL